MTQKTAQEKQRDNMAATLLKLRGQTERAVRQIHDAVELKEGYLLEIANLEDELFEKKDEFKQVISHVQGLQDKRDKLKTEIHNLENLKAASVSDGQEKVQLLDIDIRDRQAVISGLDQDTEEKRGIFAEESAAIDALLANKKEQLAEMSEAIAGGNAKLDEIKEQIEAALDVLDDTHKYADDLRSELEERLAEVGRKEARLLEANAALVEKEKELKARREDLEVYERRVIRAHKRLFPDREVVLDL